MPAKQTDRPDWVLALFGFVAILTLILLFVSAAAWVGVNLGQMIEVTR